MYKFSQLIVIFLMLSIFASQSIAAVTMSCETNDSSAQHSTGTHGSMHASMLDSEQMPHHMNAEITSVQQMSDNCCDTQCSCPQGHCSSVYVNDIQSKSNVKHTSVHKIHRLVSNYQINTLKSLYRPPITA